MAHDREYAGAVAGMADTYGPRFSPSRPVLRQGHVVDTWAVGDYVPFTDEDGSYRQGYILEVIDWHADGVYRLKSHRAGGGVDYVDVPGSRILVF